MAAISAALRRAVVARAGKLCEYCQTAEIIVVSLEIDHMLGWHLPAPERAPHRIFTPQRYNEMDNF